MAWYTSAWKQRLTGRRLRWTASRALASAAPALARRYHFYGRGAPIAAGETVFQDAVDVAAPLSEAQQAFIVERCRFDGGHSADYWRTPWAFRWSFHRFERARFLGHTGRVADLEAGALLTEHGRAEDWNRDKLAPLAPADPVPGLALPVRVFSNYFHFLFEAALPTAAYLRAASAPGGPPRPTALVASERGRRRFSEAVLGALAETHRIDLRWVGAGEAADCAAVIVWRWDSPAADWYATPPAAPQALAEALGERPLGRAEGPPRLLYLTRGAAKLRALETEPALIDALRARGAVTCDPGAMSVADQAAALGAADVIVAVHGAALGNLIFARAGARVVEIQSQGAEKSVYLALAHQLGLRHQIVMGGPGGARQRFSVDVDTVLAAVDRAMTAAGKEGAGS